MNSTDQKNVIGVVADPARVTLQEVERFLYDEAALLDEHRFEEWLALAVDDFTYEVPAIDRPDVPDGTAIKMVGDNLFRTKMRLRHLGAGYVLGESPPSRTRRMITNVRLLAAGVGTVQVTDNFLVNRFRHERMESYVGYHMHELVVVENALRMRKRLAVLDLEAIRPHGKLTILL
jgi:p-cumate 2,3-dioxygenase beta subunit